MSKHFSLCGRNNLHAAWLLRLLAHVAFFAYAMVGLSYPLDEFKNFINNKPTIEDFSFRLRTTLNQVDGIDPTTYRVFKLTYQQGHAFSFVENRRTYYTKMGSLVFWGRYGDLYWKRFNSNDVITTMRVSSETSTTNKPNVPYAILTANMRMALDGLNMGIISLETNTLIWSGTNFHGQSCIGASINGHLVLGDDQRPLGAVLQYNYAHQTYEYRVYYEYHQQLDLPDFFPARIIVKYISEKSTKTVADYEIGKLILSHRILSYNDVNYSQWINTNSIHFVFTNNANYYYKRVSPEY